MNPKIQQKKCTHCPQSNSKNFSEWELVPRILNCCALGREFFLDIAASQDTARSLSEKLHRFHSHLYNPMPLHRDRSLKHSYYQILPPVYARQVGKVRHL
jgi:hypothetical protein